MIAYFGFDFYRKSTYKLHEVNEYSHYPLPTICYQAVYMSVWFYTIMSAFASQPCGDCKNDKNGNYVCNGMETGDGDHFIIMDVSIILFMFHDISFSIGEI